VIARLGPGDKKQVPLHESASVRTEIRFIDGERRLAFGLGQMMDQLTQRGIYPSDNAVDLAIVAATVTAADTRISRSSESQDSWTREIDLYVPVAEPDVWSVHTAHLERILRFLTGDHWRLFFRARHADNKTIIQAPKELVGAPFTSICLFSGGLDSFVGAIDLLAAKENPLFVSHYWDVSTSSQKLCAHRIGSVYGDMGRAMSGRASVSRTIS
jgi:hypothetical protein